MEELQTKEFYDFGAFRLDVRNRLLWRQGKTVALTLKEFEVLLFLVENAGRVVEKEELLNAIWKDTFIAEGTLTQNISRLRKKLEASNETDGKIIETLPKRGYRFLPAVTLIKNAPALIVEEQTIQHIRIEETISVDEPAGENAIGVERVLNADHALADARALLPAPERKRPISWLWIGLVCGIVLAAGLGFIVYQTYFRNPAAKTVLTARIAPFSGLTGREGMPAFSPNGKQLAFTWNGGDSDKDLDVYVKLIGAGEPVRLTSGVNDEIYPTFSPDGRQIAFVRAFPTHSEVHIIPALGGAERKVCSLNLGSGGVSFSSDGQTLAVSESDSAGGQYSITLVNLQTCEGHRLTTPAEFVRDTTPRFSPDGQRVAFLRSFDDLTQEIFIVPATGGEVRPLTFDKVDIRSLAWSADGKRILFVSFRSNYQWNLWQIEATGSAPELIATGGSNMTNIAVSPDGKTIAYTEESHDANIWRSSPNIPAQKFIASTLADHSQQISPDGSRVVFVSDRTGNYEIWIADADGKNQLQLTDSNGSAGSPRFSPDGQFIAYDAQIENTNDIFIVSSQGGAPRRLTDAVARNILPAWSADGRFVYFCSNRGGDLEIWKIPVEGGEAKQITKQGALDSFAAPDGKEIFYSKRRGIAGLWRVPVEGGEESPVPELAEAGYWRSWTMTQKGVYYVARTASPPYRIKFYDFSNKNSTEIATMEKTPLWIFPGLSVSADGKTILYAQRDQSNSSIMLAELRN
jgi:Tol biopolymer transport system component/DNA-binding winged helix-turn-helix (wHTH) protein